MTINVTYALPRKHLTTVRVGQIAGCEFGLQWAASHKLVRNVISNCYFDAEPFSSRSYGSSRKLDFPDLTSIVSPSIFRTELSPACRVRNVMICLELTGLLCIPRSVVGASRCSTGSAFRLSLLLGQLRTSKFVRVANLIFTARNDCAYICALLF